MIHFHTYRNIDLINQGLYQIRARIYYRENNIKYYAIPYFYSDSKGSEKLLRYEETNIKPHNIIHNHISENNWEYVTKTFLIRYYDEEVEIDEFCYFRLELPHFLLDKKILYHIEFELFFSDALLALETDRKQGGNNNIDNNNNNVLNNVEFKSASNQTSFINFERDSPGYIESFNPVIYSDSFFSILNTSIHMIILDNKLRINNYIAYSSNGLNNLWAKEISEKDKEKDTSKKNSTVKKDANNNLSKKEKNLGHNINQKDNISSNYNSNSESLNEKNKDVNINNYYSNNSNQIGIGNKDQYNDGKDNNNNKNIYLDLIYNSVNNSSSRNLNSLIQFFLDSKFLKNFDINLSEEIIDELYDKYVFSMIKNYFALRKKYERLVNKLINDKIKSEFPFFIVYN